MFLFVSVLGAWPSFLVLAWTGIVWGATEWCQGALGSSIDQSETSDRSSQRANPQVEHGNNMGLVDYDDM